MKLTAIIFGLIGTILRTWILIDMFSPSALDRIDLMVEGTARFIGAQRRTITAVVLTLSIEWALAIVIVTSPALLVNSTLQILKIALPSTASLQRLQPGLLAGSQIFFLFLALIAFPIAILRERPSREDLLFAALAYFSPVAVVTYFLIFQFDTYLALADWTASGSIARGLLLAALPLVVIPLGLCIAWLLDRLAGTAAGKILAYMHAHPERRVGSLMIGFAFYLLAIAFQFADP